jgi:RimJ/RimL family protein N-acetyltransferase
MHVKMQLDELPGLPLIGGKVKVRRFQILDESRRQSWAKFTDPYYSRYNFAARTEEENLLNFIRLVDRIRLAVDDSTDRLIGYVSLKPIAQKDNAAELGICFAADAVGQHFGRETLSLVLPWACRTLGFQQIILEVDEINTRAVRLYQRLNFVIIESRWKTEEDKQLIEFIKSGGYSLGFRWNGGQLKIHRWVMSWNSEQFIARS